MENNQRVKEIQELDIRVLYFPKEDVFFAPRDIKRREQAIQKLGALQTSVCITFQDVEGAKTVVSKVKTYAKDLITLAGNAGIPVHRIIQIDQIK